jgi:hypothetical protein
MTREVRHPESEPAYSTVASVTPKLWTDGEHTCGQVFTVTELAAGETFHVVKMCPQFHADSGDTGGYYYSEPPGEELMEGEIN